MNIKIMNRNEIRLRTETLTKAYERFKNKKNNQKYFFVMGCGQGESTSPRRVFTQQGDGQY